MMLVKRRSAEDLILEPATSVLSESSSGLYSQQRGGAGYSGLRQGSSIMTARVTSLEQFMVVLDWLIRQRPDSAYSRFCLFRIAFENPQLLGSTFGAADAMRRLNQFGTLLASTVRHTDLVARELSVFWTLTPECNSECVRSRLSEIVLKVEELGLDVVPCAVGAHVFPLERTEAPSARVLLDHLAGLPASHRFGTGRDYATS
jgi:hypothetical protein